MDSYSWRGAMFAAWAVSGAISSFASFVCFPQVSFAQNAIAPDKTLPVNTVVNFDSANKTYTITGGTQVGANQFHSFRDLSVPTANTAHFDNALTTTNVIGRVTGSNISNIDGTLRTNGSASLYLINPNGIIFGANAKLDIGGSFSASTANSFKFPDGSEFSATNPQAPPLLQVSMPLGLQYGKSEREATITNRGNLSTGQDVTLAADQLDLQGRLQAGRDLTLQAQDTVKIRDSGINPLVLTSGRDMTIQGAQSVDIFALNHSQTQILSGRNLSLISNGDISGDAHFSSGGNLSFLTTTRALGNFVSKYDPIIYANGDVTFGNYTGAALKVETTGSIQGGNIRITSPDLTAISDPDSAILTTSPSVILRAGVASAPFTNIPLTTGGTTFNSSTLGIPTGSITVGNIDTTSTTTSTIGDNGGTIILSATNNINTGNLSSYSYSPKSNSSNGGSITLSTIFGNINTGNLDSDSYAYLNSGNGGNISISTTNGSINTSSLNSYSYVPLNTGINTGNGGDVTLTANGNITVAGIDTTSTYSIGGNISLLSRNGNIDTTQGNISAYSWFYDSGKVTLKAGQDVSIRNITINSASGYKGLANDINIDARNVSISNSTLDAGAYGYGKAGYISIYATDKVSFSNSKVFSRIESGAIGGFGLDVGFIDINGHTVSFTDGSQLSTSTFGKGDAGYIQINAIDSVSFSKGSSIFSNVGSEKVTSAKGNAGVISIEGRTVSLEGDSQVFSETYGKGDAGYIFINATDKVSFSNSKVFSDVNTNAVGNAGYIQIDSKGSVSFTNNSKVSSDVYSKAVGNSVGNSGYIWITANDLISIADNSWISSDIIGRGTGQFIKIEANRVSLTDSKVSSNVYSNARGNAGYIWINANDSVSLTNSKVFSNVNTNAIGNAGLIEIDAQILNILSGSQVETNTFSSGNAGNIIIRLDKSLTLDSGSEIVAGTASTGKGGNIFIDPQSINLLNGSGISVSSFGLGVGGNITMVADNLTLSNRSFITSETKSNNGGNINLTIPLLLLLRYGSGISTSSGFANAGGNGGNITINAGFIVGVPIENSDITANAFTGNGGKVTIFTNGIYGLQYRSRRTPLSDITASSEYGVQGTVNINTPGIDPSKGLSNLPANVSDPSRLVKERCSADRRGSEFIITGKGGVPANPSDRPTDTGVLDNFGTLPDRHQTDNLTSSNEPQPITTPDRIVEATGWIVNAQNQVVLVAGTTPTQSKILCP